MAQDDFEDFDQKVQAPAPAGDDFDQFDDESKSSISPWLLGAGVLGAGAAGLALKKPSLVKSAASGLQDIRRLSMLSGLAPLKSLLGNIGGAAYGSIERGSLAPLREMLSPQTAREAFSTFKAGPNFATSGPATGMSRFNIPGRIMGAMDTAAQNALQRAGYTPAEAASEMLQAPLPHEVGKALDNPVMDYLVPFRKTPVNQFLEGGRTFGTLTRPGELGKKAALATAIGTGAVSGATAEDPKTVAMTTALSGRYGMPHALAAAAGRYLSTGSKTKAAQAVQGIGPVSDYSLSEGAIGPLQGKVIPKPALISLLKYFGLTD